MLLELGKGIGFFATLISLFWIAVSAFLTPELHWPERLAVTLPRVLIAALIACLAGVLYRWPAARNPDAGRPLLTTLPMRLFLFSLALIALLFVLAYYFGCVAPLSETAPYACR